MSNVTKIVRNLDEIPEFETAEAEKEYWQTHALGGDIPFKLLRERPKHLPKPDARDLKQVSIWLDRGVRSRLKNLSETKGLRSEKLIQQFIVERLYEEEKREGLLERNE